MTQEGFQEESVEVRKARLRKLEADEEAARWKQLEAAAALTRGHNEAYFEKQRHLEEQTAEQNARNAAAQKERDKTANERSAAESKVQIEAVYGKTNKPQEGYEDMYGLVPSKRNAPRVLQPVPDPYPSSDPRHGMDEALIISMGMNPDPRQPFNKK